MNEPSFYEKLAAWGLLAGMGGAVKFITSTIKSDQWLSPRKFFFLLAANVFISGFSGLMGALIFSTVSTDRAWQLAAAGVFGYLGTYTMDSLTIVFKRRVLDAVEEEKQ